MFHLIKNSYFYTYKFYHLNRQKSRDFSKQIIRTLNFLYCHWQLASTIYIGTDESAHISMVATIKKADEAYLVPSSAVLFSALDDFNHIFVPQNIPCLT